jgi:hypothetical protein
MIFEIFLLITAVIFTGLGYWMGKNSGIEEAADHTINFLIDHGYLRHKYKGEEIELIRWNDNSQN